jgi:hypothetical protein
MSLFNYNFFTLKFSDILNYLDIFDQYNLKQIKGEENRLLSKFFKLDYVYLSFMASSEATKDIGTNDDHVYLLNTNTGKTKVTTKEFIKHVVMLNPDYFDIPFEYVIFYKKSSLKMSGKNVY